MRLIISVTLGVVGVLILMIRAVVWESRHDTETNCVGCGQLYRPSQSDSESIYLFHSLDCENRWYDIHRSEQ